MEHKHSVVVTLDGLIRCSTCGNILPQSEEEICKVTSAVQARRALEEIAVAGKYNAQYFGNYFVVYAKESNGVREEVTGEKVAERQYRIYKRLVSTKGGDA